MDGLGRIKSNSDPETYIRQRSPSLQKLNILPKRKKMGSFSRLAANGSIRSNRSNPIPALIPSSYQSNQLVHSISETPFHERMLSGSPMSENPSNDRLSSSYQSSHSSDYFTGNYNSQLNFFKASDHQNTIPKQIMDTDQYGSSLSVVNVDISDLNGDEEVMATQQSILRCKKFVLKPYKRIQLLIGWRPFRKEKETFSLIRWKIINFFYPILIISLILYYDILQGLTCQGKLNIIADTKPHPTKPSHYVMTTHGNLSDSDLLDKTGGYQIEMCSHLIPTYVLPSILHLIAFIYGFYHFRVQENEQLYSLMERVFIRTRNSIGTHELIIRNSRWFGYALYVWLCLHLILEGLYNFAYGEETNVLARALSFDNCAILITMLAIKGVGLILVNAVNIAVILNFCTQCEMLIMYIKDINLWLREKTIELKLSMHEILRVREFISVLNGTMGKMTALCVVNYLEMTVIGLCLLFLNKDDDALVWCYRSLYIVIWLIAFLIPLIQGARLSKTGQKLRQVSFEMRVFGYQTASQLELDSFILFVNSATLRAKLFGVAIRPALLLVTLGGFFFILTLLLIGEVIRIGPYRNLF